MTHRTKTAAVLLAAMLLTAVTLPAGAEPISSSDAPRATFPIPSTIHSPALPETALSDSDFAEAEDPLAPLVEFEPIGYPRMVLHVTAATLIDQFGQQLTTRDPVYDVIDGTSLQGTALSHTTVTPQLLLSPHGIAFLLNLHTRALTETTGTQNAATAYNRGVTEVRGQKQILVTPTRFVSQKARASANVEADIVGFKWTRRFGEQTALKQAYEQLPLIKRVSSVNTGDRAQIEFDRRVDRQFKKYEAQYKSIAEAQLARMPIRPDHMRFRSTPQAAIVEAYFGDGVIGNFPPTLHSNPGQQGAALQIHQSLLNDSMQQLNAQLVGQSLEEEDWAQLNNLLPESSAPPAPDRRKWTLQMPDENPVRVELTDNGVRVSLTVAAFKVGTAAYPGMLIQANFTPVIRDGQMIAERDEKLILTPLNDEGIVEGATDKTKPRKRLGVRQNIFRSMVRKRFDPVFAKELPIGDQQRSVGGNRFSISNIEISNEWATVQGVPSS